MRVVVLWPGAAITVVGDRVSVVERPTRTVSIAIATSPATPTTTESLVGRSPELSRYACVIVFTLLSPFRLNSHRGLRDSYRFVDANRFVDARRAKRTGSVQATYRRRWRFGKHVRDQVTYDSEAVFDDDARPPGHATLNDFPQRVRHLENRDVACEQAQVRRGEFGRKLSPYLAPLVDTQQH